jgi:hypothetical protein
MKREVMRIARLLEQTFEGKPYYGPSIISSLEGVTAAVAIRKPAWAVHCIWDIVAHLTAELIYARSVIDGTAGPWIEGETTWFTITDKSDAAWDRALESLKDANRVLIRVVEQLDDTILDKEGPFVRVSFFLMLHGTIQHNVYHAGQISLLKRQRDAA